jgi:Domain of unknown function (DUF4145)
MKKTAVLSILVAGILLAAGSASTHSARGCVNSGTSRVRTLSLNGDLTRENVIASAALSRRCLQHLLREQANIKPADLANEIQQVLDSKTLPSYLAEALDALRNIGNFAAHLIKSKSTGEIVDVEPGEAEWLLDTLEGLF